ncbi:BadF/BadG/BcrA/BcrD ATPase family protein [Fodinicurvata sp. EGI_FJ10296]|uniref:BadF/BadG/BcrA/BcrD ATPase family protein n=1 Tax=Fodinicurvata sp. EGI_FJ10296 TaxID=3231908 RepID=UPI0034524E79
MTNSDRRIYIGIDGGGSGSRARLVDGSGRLLGTATGRPANMATDAVAAWGAVMGLCDDALQQAGLSRETLDRTVAGIALAGLGQSRERRRAETLAHPFRSRALASDAEAACLGAHNGGDGGIVIAGTGSIAVAMVGGRTTRIGGWGFPISDHGSGAWLGLEAVREGLLAHDGLRPEGTLARAVMGRFRGDPEAVVAFRSRAGPGDYATMAPMVVDAAAAGDPSAKALLRDSGRMLGLMASRLVSAGAERLSIVGGLADPLTPFLPAAIQGTLAPALGDGVDGALILAHRIVGRS